MNHDSATVPAPPKIRLLNVDFDNITMDELLERRSGTIITVHVDSIVKLQHDREFYDLVSKFDVVTCDSQVLVFAARLLGTPVKERVSGSDYLPRFYARYATDESVTIYLCGAMGDIAQQARQRINSKVGRQIVVGAYGPPVGWLDDVEEVERVIADINASQASVLVVGVGPPGQERFIHRYRDRLPHVKLLLPLGGTIDYEAGVVVRPPAVVTNIGMEWLWRLVREPRRRWRRYVLHQPPVIWYLIKQRLGRYRNPMADADAD